MKRLYLWFTKKIWFKPNIFAKIKPSTAASISPRISKAPCFWQCFVHQWYFNFEIFIKIIVEWLRYANLITRTARWFDQGWKRWPVIIFDESLWLLKFSIIIRSKRVEFQWEFVAGEIQLILERTIHLSSIVLRNEIWYFSII